MFFLVIWNYLGAVLRTYPVGTLLLICTSSQKETCLQLFHSLPKTSSRTTVRDGDHTRALCSCCRILTAIQASCRLHYVWQYSHECTCHTWMYRCGIHAVWCMWVILTQTPYSGLLFSSVFSPYLSAILSSCLRNRGGLFKKALSIQCI